MLDARQEYIWDSIVEFGIATSEEVGLVVGINGVSEKTLNDIIWVRTGYRDIEQFLNYDEEDEQSSFFLSQNFQTYNV